jgi:hypothetical protein
VLSALLWLRDSLPGLLAPLAGLAGLLLGLPALLGLALGVGLVVWAIYRLVQWQWWQRWDEAARQRFLAAAVASSLARLRSPTTPPAGVTG